MIHNNKKEYWKYHQRKLKSNLVSLAGDSCQRCGYKEFLSGLAFHHVYPLEKFCNPVVVINSGDAERAWRELDKCCLLCLNCHKSYDAGDWRAEFIKRDGLGWTIGQPLPLTDERYKHKPITYKLSSFQLELL